MCTGTVGVFDQSSTSPQVTDDGRSARLAAIGGSAPYVLLDVAVRAVDLPADRSVRTIHEEAAMPLTLRSPAFDHQGDVPSRHTCDGEDLSPPLAWEQVPHEARSLVLLVDDPDAPDPRAPQRVWVHWIVYGLPPATRALDEGASPDRLPDGAREARNDFGRTAWGGPCPPIGRHRYFFRLHALDVELGDLGPSAGRREVEAAMQGHVLETAELMATYERPAGAR